LRSRTTTSKAVSTASELERVFVEAGTSPAELESVKADRGLGLFIRSLVGLDREAAVRAFAGFIAGRTLSANQLEFIDMIIEHLTACSAMDARLLYEARSRTSTQWASAACSADPTRQPWCRSSTTCAGGPWRSGVGLCAEG
jgi:hypothetical protein